MKKNKYILLLVINLIALTVAFSQNKNGEIIYQITNSPYFKKSKQETKRTESQKMADHIFKLSVEKVKEFRWKLTFLNNKAIFKGISVMGTTQKEEALLLMAEALVSVEKSYYTNIKRRKQIIESNFNYENYLINKSIDISTWKLTSNTKKIGNYLCYEAVRTIKITNSKGKLIDRKQQVWYSSQIPVPFGPKEFVGFPGLVLQVTDGKTTFVATKITLNTPKKIVIKPPTKGNKVTEQEMKKITKEWTNKNTILLKRR